MSEGHASGPVRAVGYVRVSTAEQANGFGLEMQTQAIRRYCKAEGLRLASVARDEARSGSNGLDSRTGLQEALAAVETGAAAVLVVYRFDRLARDLVLCETLVQRIEQAGGRVVSVTEPDVSTDDATRVLVRQILGAVAAYERLVTRRRMDDGRARAMAEGRRGQGRAPYGYKAEGGALVPISEEQATISAVRHMRADGLSLSAIAAALNDDDVPSKGGGRWHPTSVARLLRP